MTKLLVLSAPIGAGKTEAVKYLKRYFPLVDRKCKEKLYELTQAFFCVSEERFYEIYDDRELKEKAMPDFKLTVPEYNKLARYLGKKYYPEGAVAASKVFISIREAMIYISEIVVKPAMGENYFGVARVVAMQEGELAIDDSCGGWADEVNPAIEALGEDNVLAVRVHGRGTFDGDSRCYLPDGVTKDVVDIYNVGTEQEFLEEILRVAKWFYGEEKLYDIG